MHTFLAFASPQVNFSNALEICIFTQFLSYCRATDGNRQCVLRTGSWFYCVKHFWRCCPIQLLGKLFFSFLFTRNSHRLQLNNVNTTLLQNLTAGSYPWSIEDSNGCKASGVVSVNQPNGMRYLLIEETL